jgi:hypothetical protein
MPTINHTTGYNAVAAAAAMEASAPKGITAIASLLPDPNDALALSSDPVAALAELAVKTGNTERDTASKARAAEQQVEKTQDDLQVQAMRDKADDIRTSGMVEGIGMMAGAGLSMAAAGNVLPNGQMSADGRRLDAASKFTGALTEIRSSASKANEAMDDANAAAHKAGADQAKSAADDAHDGKKDAGDFISAALDFYREYTSSKSAERNAALHRS